MKDWKGVTDLTGKPLPYSAAAAEELFTALPDFLNDVAQSAAARETFTAEGTEAAKNG